MTDTRLIEVAFPLKQFLPDSDYDKYNRCRCDLILQTVDWNVKVMENPLL